MLIDLFTKMGEKPPPYPTSNYTTSADYGMGAPPVGGVAAQPLGSGAPPPPPPGAVVTTAPGTTTVMMSNIVQTKRIFTKHPTAIICQHCNTSVVSQPRAEVGATTWLVAGFLILVGCWLGCCFIPFCIDDCKDIYHDCPNCHKVIDLHKPL